MGGSWSTRPRAETVRWCVLPIALQAQGCHRAVSRVGGTESEWGRCEHLGEFACEAVSQPWLLVVQRETKLQLQFWGYSMMVGAEQREKAAM